MPRQLFPYVGGKYTVAPEINKRFGEIDTRIDAFTGSSSWILASPPVAYEIVNDLDGYVVNYLRAIKSTPETDCPNSSRGWAATRTTTIRSSRRGGRM